MHTATHVHGTARPERTAARSGLFRVGLVFRHVATGGGGTYECPCGWACPCACPCVCAYPSSRSSTSRPPRLQRRSSLSAQQMAHTQPMSSGAVSNWRMPTKTVSHLQSPRQAESMVPTPGATIFTSNISTASPYTRTAPCTVASVRPRSPRLVVFLFRRISAQHVVAGGMHFVVLFCVLTLSIPRGSPAPHMMLVFCRETRRTALLPLDGYTFQTMGFQDVSIG